MTKYDRNFWSASSFLNSWRIDLSVMQPYHYEFPQKCDYNEYWQKSQESRSLQLQTCVLMLKKIKTCERSKTN